MRTSIACLHLFALMLLTTPSAFAALFVQNLDYTAATQSMWGPGGSAANFGASGSTSVGIVDLYSYSLGASAGTVQARHNGALTAVYDDVLAAPGLTSINFAWQGDAGGGLIRSDFGAFINVTALGFTVIDEDYGLNISQTYTPMMPDSTSGSDSATGITGSVDVVIAEAGAELRPEQTSTLDVSGLTGSLAYSLRGSGVVNLRPFTLTSGGMNLDFNLADAGIWDFYLADSPVLNNLYTASFDIDLVLFEEHVGVTGCLVEIFGVCTIPELGTVRNETTLASLNVWDRDPFALLFANGASLSSFSITVDDRGIVNPPTTVPEPSALALLGIGLLALGLMRRSGLSRARG